jgi:hypothetical protein
MPITVIDSALKRYEANNLITERASADWMQYLAVTALLTRGIISERCLHDLRVLTTNE